MRAFSNIAIIVGSVWIGMHAAPAAAQTFEDRWSIIPKAKAAPAPPAVEPAKPQPDAQPLSPSPIGAKARRSSRGSAQTRTFKSGFSGKASYYSYTAGKTASGSSYDRNGLTAAHRSLPFGTRVRVTDRATSKSVVVVITDRGPRRPDRVLDLSLGAARALGMTDRGVVHVRAEVL
jgi:rare lipoprotein A